MEADTETYRHRERAKIGDLHHFLPLGGHGTLMKKGKKNGSSQKDLEHKKNKSCKPELSGSLRGSQRIKRQSQTLYGLC